ncbi:glycosyltransferase family 4 protein [Riemerella anatipestifer]|nr:glycosyltransferase family 4 protein [Riemerella anatipestifer]MDY3357674.1 glycosyltransferase family 4 protein [Riemerella anatipestifer]
MKILVFIADISRAGGTERATINLANMLTKNHKVKIVSLSHSTQPFFSLEDKVEVACLGAGEFPQSMKKKIGWYFQLFSLLKKCIKDENPDILIGEGHNISAFLPLVKTKGMKTIACEHIDFDSIPIISKVMIRLLYPKLDKIVTLSSIAQAKIQHLNANTEIIPNSLSFSVSNPSNLEAKRIIMVGRISSEKGYERVVPIAKRLMIDFPEWNIDIFGNGDLKEEIQRLYDENQLKNVRINLPVKEIKQEYLNSSLHLITSYNEAMPMVILEAQNCGLPVIGYYCEGTASLIQNKKTGFIVNSEDEFYEKIKLIIENEAIRKEMGNNARIEAQKYSIESIEKQWMELLETI